MVIQEIKNHFDGQETASYQIVSPPFSCGVAWLVNILLELDIKTTNVGFGQNHWSFENDLTLIEPEALNHLKWHLPILHRQEKFVFEANIEVFWEHRLDFVNQGHKKTILFIRDPRDAIYSMYYRNYKEHYTFDVYLKRQDVWPDHFPGLFELPPFETFTFFVFFWMTMSQFMPVKIIDFKNTKAIPVKTVQEILKYLEIDRTNQEVEKAVEHSSFENAKRAMDEMQKATKETFLTARKGKVDEWKQTYSEELLSGITEVGKISFGLLDEGEAHVSHLIDTYIKADSRSIIADKLPEEVNEIVVKILDRFQSGIDITREEVHTLYQIENMSTKVALRIAMILEALYYVENIFENKISDEAKAALNTFIAMNLRFEDDYPIQQAAVSCLRRWNIPLKPFFDKAQTC